jgi:hypothetical protein
MELKGKVIQLLPLQTGQGKKGEWKKLGFVIETEGQYPKKIALSCWGDKVDSYQLRVGDVGTFHLDPESREHNGKWYTEIRVWKLDKHSSGPAVQQQKPTTAEPFVGGADVDDLPF